MSKPSYTNTLLSHELFHIVIGSLLFVGNEKRCVFNSFLKLIKDVAIVHAECHSINAGPRQQMLDHRNDYSLIAHGGHCYWLIVTLTHSVAHHNGVLERV